MKNFISLGGVTVYLTDEQTEKILDVVAGIREARTQLNEVAVGEVFNVDGYEFVVLEHADNGTVAILKEPFPDESTFGENNDYRGSIPDTTCESFADALSAEVGADNIVSFEVDLTSDDGLKDYGVVTRRCSLLTMDQYRKYVQILDRYKPDAWWWLATAYSSAAHDNTRWCKCVSPSGCINDNYCGYFSRGVRPFLIFKSNIFVSK